MGLSITTDYSTSIFSTSNYFYNKATVQIADIPIYEKSKYYEEIMKNPSDYYTLNDYEILDALVEYVNKKQGKTNSQPDNIFAIDPTCSTKVVHQLPEIFDAEANVMYINLEDHGVYILNEDLNDWIIVESNYETEEKEDFHSDKKFVTVDGTPLTATTNNPDNYTVTIDTSTSTTATCICVPDPRDTEISELKERLNKLENKVSEEESSEEFTIIDNIITW